MFEMRKIERFVGTEEQEAIWEAIKKREEHLLIEALAGTGKTKTLEEGVRRQFASIANGQRYGVCVFGKANGEELKSKMPHGVWAGTTHALGFKILHENLERCDVQQDKTWDIITELRDEFLEGRYWKKGERPAIRQLVSLLKQAGYRPQQEDPNAVRTIHVMEEVCLKHDIHWPGDERVLYEYSHEVLKVCCKRTAEVDFDDQIWLPYVLDLEFAGFDVLLVDEAQDLNPVQHALTLRSGRRLVVVGDRHQSVYGFRGADPDSIPKYEKALRSTERGLLTLPLTMCWRCPQHVIETAQALVPAIRCRQDAPRGAVELVDFDEMYEGLTPGDMVICRTNLPLLQLLYRLWRDLRPAYIQGRDVAERLLRLVERFEDESESLTLAALNRWLDEYEREELEKLESRKGSSSAIAALQDKCDCLRVMIDYTPAGSGVKGLTEHMKALFADKGNPKKQIRLSTVHRAKGLEAEIVYVLEPGLMPHYLCKLPWEMEQERNIAYVAITRAKGELYFVGGYPPILEVSSGLTATPPVRWSAGEYQHALEEMLEDSQERQQQLLADLQDSWDETEVQDDGEE